MGFFTMRAISHANEIEDTNMKTIVSAGIVLILVRWLASRGNKLPGIPTSKSVRNTCTTVLERLMLERDWGGSHGKLREIRRSVHFGIVRLDLWWSGHGV